MAEEEVRKLVLPYDHTQLPALLASIKNETELRTFVLEYAEAKGTSLTESQVNTLIATYITEHNIGSGNSQSGTGLTPEQAQKLAMLLTDGNGEKYLGDDGAYHNIPAGNAGTSIDDTTTSSASTWSSSKIHQEIENKTVSQSQINNAVSEYLTENPVSGVTNALSKMNIAILGDSISDVESGENGYGMWIDKFRSLASPKSFTDYAVGGAVWTFSSTTQSVSTRSEMTASNANNCIGNQFNRLKASVDNNTIATPDLIFILAGSNDAFQNKTVGTPSTVFETDTAQSSDITTLTNLCASVRYVVDKINAEYPNARIVLMTPIAFGGHASEFARLTPIRSAIQECAEYLGIYCIDGCKAGITFHREHLGRKYLISDLAHLTKLGGDLVGKFIFDELSNLPFIMTKSLYGASDDIEVEATGISINDVASNLLIKGQHPIFTVSMLPSTANVSRNRTDISSNVTFTSSNTSICMFPGQQALGMGYANLNGSGTVTITARDSVTGFTATKEVTIANSAVTSYTVTNTLAHASNSNNASTINENSSYSATITANTGYTLDSVIVTMGGTDITSTAYNNGTISIASVTGNVVITVTTTANTYTVTKNATNCTITGNASATHGSSYTATIEADSGYTLQTPTITMGGNTLSGVYSNGTVTIPNVTGNIAITASAIETGQEIHATAISLSPSTVSFNAAGDTSTITPTLTPNNTTDTITSWVSSDTNVATVSNGVITSVANGSATITATTSNGLTATVSVTVSISHGGDGITVPNDYSYSMTTPTTFDSNTRQIDTNLKLQSSNAGAYSLVVEWDNPTPITDQIQALMSCGNPVYSGALNGWSVTNNSEGSTKFKLRSGVSSTELTNVEKSNKQVLILTRASGAYNLSAYTNSATAINCPLNNTTHDYNWILGCDVNGTPRFTGTIYSAYKYDRVLTAEEIASIFS